MKNNSQEDLDFLTALKNMDDLFWKFSNLEKLDQDLSNLSKKELISLSKKYSKLISNEKIKEVIKLLLDYRISCIEKSIATSSLLYQKIEECGGYLYHYCPPDMIHIFRLSTFDNRTFDRYGGTISEYRYYSRRPKKIEKSIERSTYELGDIKTNYNGWVKSNLNISKYCAEFIEAEDYLRDTELFLKSKTAIRQLVDNFSKITKQYNIKNNYIVFEYLGKKFSIDFQKQDILSEDEFILQW